MKTLLTLTVIAAMMMAGSSAMAYVEDAEDGLAQGWTSPSFGGAYLDDIGGQVVPRTVPWGGALSVLVGPEKGAWASDGTVNSFGAGTYTMDIDWRDSYANSMFRPMLLGSNVNNLFPDWGITLEMGVFGGIFLQGYAAGTRTTLVNDPWATCPLEGGGQFFNLKVTITPAMVVSIEVLSYSRGDGYIAPAGMTNVDMSLFAPTGEGFVGFFAHNYAEKYVDNLTFTPIPEPTVGLLGLAALAFIRRRK